MAPRTESKGRARAIQWPRLLRTRPTAPTRHRFRAPRARLSRAPDTSRLDLSVFLTGVSVFLTLGSRPGRTARIVGGSEPCTGHTMAMTTPDSPDLKPRTDLLDEVDASLVGAAARSARAFFLYRLAVAAVVLPLLGVAFAWSGEGGWRVALVAVAAVAVALSIAYDLRHAGAPGRARLTAYTALLLGLHTVIIATTGGVESPALPVYIPVTVVLAVAVGRRRTVAVILALLSGFVVAFLAVRLAGGPIGVPSLLRTAPPAPLDPLYLSLVAAAEVAFLVLGALVGLRLRAAFNAAAVAVSEARAETLAAVAAQNRELAMLSSTLAHELKNPLAAIQSLSSLVARKLDPASRQADQMRVLINEVHRLGQILDEFLNLSRPLDELRAVPADPAALVRSVARLYEGRTRERQVRMEVVVDAYGTVRCDPQKIRQVLVNLVENALQHTPPGGTVRLRVARDGPVARIHVEDDGPGLSPEAARHAFEPGYTTRAGGSGLGLTVARSIARQHGGDLTLTNRPGGGAVATLTLPVEEVP